MSPGNQAFTFESLDLPRAQVKSTYRGGHCSPQPRALPGWAGLPGGVRISEAEAVLTRVRAELGRGSGGAKTSGHLAPSLDELSQGRSADFVYLGALSSRVPPCPHPTTKY